MLLSCYGRAEMDNGDAFLPGQRGPEFGLLLKRKASG